MPERTLTISANPTNELAAQVTRTTASLRGPYYVSQESRLRVLDLYTTGLTRPFSWIPPPMVLPRQLPGEVFNADRDTLLFENEAALFAFTRHLDQNVRPAVAARLIAENRPVRSIAFSAERRYGFRRLYLTFALIATFTQLDIIYLEFDGPEDAGSSGIMWDRAGYRNMIRSGHQIIRAQQGVPVNDPRIVFLNTAEMEELRTGVRRDANGAVIPPVEMSSSESEGGREEIGNRRQQWNDATTRYQALARESASGTAAASALLRANANKSPSGDDDGGQAPASLNAEEIRKQRLEMREKLQLAALQRAEAASLKRKASRERLEREAKERQEAADALQKMRNRRTYVTGG